MPPRQWVQSHTSHRPLTTQAVCQAAGCHVIPPRKPGQSRKLPDNVRCLTGSEAIQGPPVRYEFSLPGNRGHHIAFGLPYAWQKEGVGYRVISNFLASFFSAGEVPLSARAALYCDLWPPRHTCARRGAGDVIAGKVKCNSSFVHEAGLLAKPHQANRTLILES